MIRKSLIHKFLVLSAVTGFGQLSSAYGLTWHKPRMSTQIKCVVEDQEYIFSNQPLSKCYKEVPYVMIVWKPRFTFKPTCGSYAYFGEIGAKNLDPNHLWEIEVFDMQECENIGILGFGHKWMNLEK